MPHKVPFADLKIQHDQIRPEIDLCIRRIIEDSNFIQGDLVREFEDKFSALIGTKHCISCANGTDALFIALRCLGVSKGCEVITTAHSWISTSEVITQAGGQIVFCDTNSSNFCMDVKKVESLVTNKTVGIIPVHLYGHPVDMDPLMEIASRNNLWILEDCAQAHLARYKGRMVGTFGKLASFSFYPGKNLGAIGDAGALVTNDDESASWCKLFSCHGGKGLHVMEGINSRMDAIQAAVLSLKIPHLRRWTEERILIAKKYNDLLNSIMEIELPSVATNCQHVYHLYTIKCRDRDKLRNYLSGKGIQTNINYPIALPFLPAYKYMREAPINYPNALSNQSSILSLPLYPGMNDKDINYVCKNICDFYK